MGMKLVGMVLTKWAPHVPDRAFRLLVRMAMTALDEPNEKVEAALYFGGKDPLLSVLRAERNGSIKSIERALERGIGDLVSAGAIERVNRAFTGERAIYRLTLFNAIRIEVRKSADQKEPDTHRQESPTPTGKEPDTHGYDSPTPTGEQPDTHRGAYEKEEVLEEEEEQREEEVVSQRGPVTVRAHASEPEAPIDSTSKCGDPTCFMGFRYDGTKPKKDRNIRCPTCKPDPSNVIPFRRTG